MLFRLLLTAFLIWPLAGMTQEDVRKSDVVRLLKKIQLEQNSRPALRAVGFEGAKLDLMLDHGRKLAGNTVILNFVADRLIAARSGQLGGPVDEMLVPLLNRGMPYLPVKEQLYHLRVELTVMKALSPANCGRTVKETIAPQVLSQTLSRTIARLNAPALKEYLRVVRKASTLGVSRPRPPAMSNATREAVLLRFSQNIAAGAAQAGLSKSAARADVDIRRLSNQEACKLGILFVETILNTKGSDLRPLLELFWRDFT